MNSTEEWSNALLTLLDRLDDFHDRLASSCGDEPPPPITHKDDLHYAIRSVEKFYRAAKLPMEIRNIWTKLLRCSRDSEGDPTLRSIKAGKLSRKLLKWAHDELERLASLRTATDPKPKRRGHPQADYETRQREAKLAADWKRAHENKAYKADFANDNTISLKEFDKLLNRVAKRKKRSDK